jgi:probable rRNA maturation factor
MPARPQPIVVGGAVSRLGARRIARAVDHVLTHERRRATVTVTVLGKGRMRELNRAYLRHDRVTDVLAFPLQLPGGELAGDIYLCHYAAARQARAMRVPLPEELTRLAVHGTLHVLGYDHPAGHGRERSSMWRRQERYVRALA